MYSTTITRRKNQFFILIASKFFAILTIAAHLFCIYKYCIGTSYAFGNVVSVTKSIEMVFGILSMSGAYYRGICNSLLGVAYLLMLVIMIKNFITTCTAAKYLVTENKLKKEYKYMVSSCGRSTGYSFFCNIIFAFLCIAVKDYRLPHDIYILAAVWGFISLLTKIIFFAQENQKFHVIITKAFYDFVAIISVGLILFLTKYPVVENFIYAIKILPILPKQSFLAMIMPVLYAIAITSALLLISNVLNEFIHLQYAEITNQAKKVMIVCISLGIGSIAVLALGGYTTRLDFDNIVTMFKPFISIVSASVALLIISNLPTDYIKENSLDKKYVHLYSINEKGSLHINNGVTDIEPYAFLDRVDITEVTIPASVVSIGEKAFKGCTGIKKIYCSYKEQPLTWAQNWNEACDAEIYWTATNTETTEETPSINLEVSSQTHEMNQS